MKKTVKVHVQHPLHHHNQQSWVKTPYKFSLIAGIDINSSNTKPFSLNVPPRHYPPRVSFSSLLLSSQHNQELNINWSSPKNISLERFYQKEPSSLYYTTVFFQTFSCQTGVRPKIAEVIQLEMEVLWLPTVIVVCVHLNMLEKLYNRNHRSVKHILVQPNILKAKRCVDCALQPKTSSQQKQVPRQSVCRSYSKRNIFVANVVDI